MAFFQDKLCIAIMDEKRFFPIVLHVASLAFLSELPRMFIIERVAGDTNFRGFFVLLLGMAIATFGFAVTAP